ncbi:MAG: hypothetical protein RLZZ214_704 [Verrucomicrobiota bacterium]|jgi:PBP1b-binding outer membrane lipoprotein LpoB
MKRNSSILLLVLVSAFGFSSCASDTEPKPVGPVSDTSKIPWNAPIAGQGQGQLGMMPQNQYRR